MEEFDMGCDICGSNGHLTDSCPELGQDTQSHNDLVTTLARQTLPSHLAVVQTSDRVDVLCKTEIPARTRFGPFIARRISEETTALSSSFLLKIFTREGSYEFLDYSNENECNWLCLVQAAVNETEQNLIAFQLGLDLFYSTSRDVLAGELLKVWYAPGYAKKLGMPLRPQMQTEGTSILECQFVYPCPVCRNVAFGSEGELSDHMAIHQHSSVETASESLVRVKPERCSRCSDAFFNASQLAIHIRDVHLGVHGELEKTAVRKRTWPCSECGVVFSNPRGLGNHKKLHHPKEPLNITIERIEDSCPSGSLPDSDGILITNHFEKPIEVPLNISGESYGRGKRKRNLPRRLLDTDADAEGVHDCPYCPEICTSEDALKDHLATVHVFQCSLCKVSFNTEEGLEKHMCKGEEFVIDIAPFKADDGRFMCVQCPLDFTDAETFHAHLVWHCEHLPCEVCKEQCSGVAALEVHVKSCTGPTNLGLEPSVRYMCDICQMDLSDITALHVHAATHTDFKCDKCATTFATRFGLHCHLLDCDVSQLQMLNPVFACIECKAVLSSQMALDYHNQMHLRAAGFECIDCHGVFQEKVEFETHDCRSSEETHQCEICGKGFGTSKNLSRHLLKHAVSFNCTLCRKQFDRKEDLIKHSLECSAKEMFARLGQINCPHCEKIFYDAHKYRTHLVVHTHSHTCRNCGKRFRCKSQLLSHCSRCGRKGKGTGDEEGELREEQGDGSYGLHEGRFTCPICSKGFVRKDFYLSHQCRNEEGKVIDRPSDIELLTQVDQDVEQSCTCDQCGKEFTSQSNLNKHLKLHGDKDIRCDVCNKAFYQIHAMRLHYDSVHTDKLRVQCSQCQRVFRNKYSLQTHVKQFHAPHITIYACEVCGKKFRQKGNMQKHMLTHESQRRYTCQFCPKAFKYPEQLKRHSLLHTQGKSLACEICDRRFVMAYELRKHTKEMHSNKVFVCQFCTETCRWRHTMRRHIKRKHPRYSNFADDLNFLNSLLREANEVSSELAAVKLLDQSAKDGVNINPMTIIMDSITAEQMAELTGDQIVGHVSDEGATLHFYAPDSILPHGATDMLHKPSVGGIRQQQHLTINHQQFRINFSDGQTILTPVELSKEDHTNDAQIYLSGEQSTEYSNTLLAGVGNTALIATESHDMTVHSNTVTGYGELVKLTTSQQEELNSANKGNYVFFNILPLSESSST